MHVRARAWELQQSLNDHLLTARDGAERVADLLALVYRERAVQSSYERTVNVLPTPLLLETADHERLTGDMARFTDLLLDLPRRLYGGDLARMCRDVGLGPLETRSICAVGAGAPVAFARWDLFETERGWRLIEVGVGGGMGLGEVGDLNRLQLADPLVGPFLRQQRLRYRDPLEAFAADVRRACSAAGMPEAAMVAVVDWTRYHGECAAFLDRYAAAMRRVGFRAQPCHVRQLERRDGRLHLGDQAVDALVMNYLLEDLSQDPEDIEPILASQVDRSVLSVMTHYGDLVGSKGSLALLWRAMEEGRLAPAEAELVSGYVPETRIVEPGPLRLLGVEGNAAGVLTALQRRLVLKPVVGSSSAGVFLGPACDDGTWQSAVRSALDAPRTYVAQRLVEPAAVSLPVVDGSGALEVAERTVLLSVFVVAGAGHAGYVVRCGRPGPPSLVATGRGAEVASVFHP